MGKGDKKTGRGKRNAGSYGKTRKKNSPAKIPVKVLGKTTNKADKHSVAVAKKGTANRTENLDD